MAAQSKTQLLNSIHALLKRRYKPKVDRNASKLSVLNAVVYGICHEDTTREHANQALSRFNDQFYDWNEIRVSSVDEIQQTLAGIPDPETRAQRIRRFLRQLFNRTYSFSLDALAKKPLKEALKVLRTYDAFESDYVTATVIQHALGGHAIPVDKPGHRALQRLGIAEPEVPALRAMLERAVPKNRGAEFLDLIEDLTNDTCVEEEPDCTRCELRKICMFALNRKSEPRASGRAHPLATARRLPRQLRESPLRPRSLERSRSRRQNPPRRRPAPASRPLKNGVAPNRAPLQALFIAPMSLLAWWNARVIQHSGAWHISRCRAKISGLVGLFGPDEGAPKTPGRTRADVLAFGQSDHPFDGREVLVERRFGHAGVDSIDSSDPDRRRGSSRCEHWFARSEYRDLRLGCC